LSASWFAERPLPPIIKDESVAGVKETIDNSPNERRCAGCRKAMFAVAALGHESWIFSIASLPVTLHIALGQYSMHIRNCFVSLFAQLLKAIRGIGFHKNKLIPLFPSFLLLPLQSAPSADPDSLIPVFRPSRR